MLLNFNPQPFYARNHFLQFSLTKKFKDIYPKLSPCIGISATTFYVGHAIGLVPIDLSDSALSFPLRLSCSGSFSNFSPSERTTSSRSNRQSTFGVRHLRWTQCMPTNSKKISPTKRCACETTLCSHQPQNHPNCRQRKSGDDRRWLQIVWETFTMWGWFAWASDVMWVVVGGGREPGKGFRIWRLAFVEKYILFKLAFGSGRISTGFARCTILGVALTLYGIPHQTFWGENAFKHVSSAFRRFPHSACFLVRTLHEYYLQMGDNLMEFN